ncbi:MAG: Ribonuclease [Phycisphaerales bacterium]|nr:Ribonuclease [Phycisphaerales bacterium]
MLDWQDDLKLAESNVYLDSRRGRSLCFVSHAHTDHLGPHEHAICTPATEALARRRTELQRVTALNYCTEFFLDDRTEAMLLPAGHILGSAMLHVRREQSMLYTGDFRLRGCEIVSPAQVRQADVLVMESTYGLPFFRFPPRGQIIAELLELVERAFSAGRQPIVMGYSLGKSQEIVKILTDGGHRVTVHGAVFHNNQVYGELGVQLGSYRRYASEDFHGASALDMRERGVLVAPPQVARSPFVTRFNNPCRIIMTGWALLKNSIYRFGVDHALPLSDHADFDELMELIERVQPRKIFTHHGYREFAETLRRKGLDATCAKKDPQLTLFGE